MLEPKTKRHRSFCERVARGEPLGEAWAHSARDVGKRPGSRAADNVSGSRNAAKFADWIAHLKVERADARIQASEPVTRESIHALLEEVTASLTQASVAASAAGADGIAQQLHKVLIIHAGRRNRASARAPEEEDTRPTFDPTKPLARLQWCTCTNA